MNHERDYDRDGDREDALTNSTLKRILNESLEKENDLMRTYLITAERVKDNPELQERLQNFAEGNAKRTQQLIDEIGQMH